MCVLSLKQHIITAGQAWDLPPYIAHFWFSVALIFRSTCCSEEVRMEKGGPIGTDFVKLRNQIFVPFPIFCVLPSGGDAGLGRPGNDDAWSC